MKNKTLNVISKGFILLSAFSFVSVSFMAFKSPQAVMDLVGTTLPNTDAFSSIRGVYGGVGLSITLLLVYLLKNHASLALGFLAVLSGMYAVSRTITIFAEGALGAFGTQWLMTESVFCLIAVVLYVLNARKQKQLSDSY